MRLDWERHVEQHSTRGSLKCEIPDAPSCPGKHRVLAQDKRLRAQKLAVGLLQLDAAELVEDSGHPGVHSPSGVFGEQLHRRAYASWGDEGQLGRHAGQVRGLRGLVHR